MIALIQNPVDHAANKHIRLGCHYARELTEEKTIAPQRVSTDKNLADLFTKPYGVAAFRAAVAAYVSGPADQPPPN